MKHPSPIPSTNLYSRLAPCLIVLLIGLHVLLLGAGAFCASRSFDPNSTHHSHPAESLSLLCSWACHVAQIASGAGSIPQWSALVLLLLLWALKPAFTFPRTFPVHTFSPRGPPVRLLIHG
ncbi:hypothetical protein [Candidatus Nitrospira allomarina]|uniref:Uncharacterized protein n=1 Tax=Candidatus Nitrospira allomarina TaxID=3020900 RepID=A0AA96GGE0_9BACT|nr:hypothetical protein [Candidatus Nitrospira allomarina]WNM59815.1 hypothetical protein PP769_08685 [Candidatus Nitrospira allomarina]